MTSFAQFLLVVVITTLTFLVAIIAIQIVHLIHDLRKAIQKFSHLLDHSDSLSDLVTKDQNSESDVPMPKKNLFKRAGLPLRPS